MDRSFLYIFRRKIVQADPLTPLERQQHSQTRWVIIASKNGLAGLFWCSYDGEIDDRQRDHQNGSDPSLRILQHVKLGHDVDHSMPGMLSYHRDPFALHDRRDIRLYFSVPLLVDFLRNCLLFSSRSRKNFVSYLFPIANISE